MKRHLKNLTKLEEKGVVDKDYVYVRKNAFYSHIKDSSESISFKQKVNPVNTENS